MLWLFVAFCAFWVFSHLSPVSSIYLSALFIPISLLHIHHNCPWFADCCISYIDICRMKHSLLFDQLNLLEDVLANASWLEIGHVNYLNIVFIFSENCSSSLHVYFLSYHGLVGSQTRRYIVECLAQQKLCVVCYWLSYQVLFYLFRITCICWSYWYQKWMFICLKESICFTWLWRVD